MAGLEEKAGFMREGNDKKKKKRLGLKWEGSGQKEFEILKAEFRICVLR